MQNYEVVTVCNILLSTGDIITRYQVLEDDPDEPMIVIKPYYSKDPPTFVNRAHIVTIDYAVERFDKED